MSDYERKLSRAIELIVFDQEGRFDGCLVELLFDLLYKMGEDSPAAKIIEKSLINMYQDECFKKANLPRLFDFHTSALVLTPSIKVPLLEKIPYLLPQIDQNCLCTLLSLLNVYIQSDSGCEYIIETPLSPFELNQHTISSCLDLIRYIMETSNNYRVLLEAQSFIHSIVQSSYIRPEQRSVDGKIKKFIDDLMLSENQQIYLSMKELMSWKEHNKMDEKHHACRPIIKRSFDKMIEKINSKATGASSNKTIEANNNEAVKVSNNKKLITLATTMAHVTQVKDTGPVIESLRKAKKLEAIIAFSTSNIEYVMDRDILKYVLYPILTKCNTEDSQVLTARLHITREEGIFIDINMKDKYLIHCFRFIDEFTRNPMTDDQLWLRVAHKRKMLLFQVVLEYVKCQQLCKSSYRNVLQALSILSIAPQISCKKSEIMWLFESFKEVYDLIDKLDREDPMHRPLIIGYIRLIRESLHKFFYHFSSSPSLVRKVSDYFMQAVNLAFKFEDCDILEEFVALFSKNAFQYILEYGKSCNEDHERFVQLVWHHIKGCALKGDHQELLGTLTDLLIAIDLYIDSGILAKQGIVKRQDIPKYLGQILIDYSTRIQTVEAVIERLRCAKIKKLEEGRLPPRIPLHQLTYLRFLDLGPRKEKDSLDYVIKGLCLAAKGECCEKVRLRALDELYGLIDNFNNNEKHFASTLIRLVRTNILETFYDIPNGTLYPAKIRQLTCGFVLNIQKSFVRDIPQKRLHLLAIMRNESTGIEQSKIEKIIDFYISEDSIKNVLAATEEEDVATNCDFTIESYVDQIIAQDENNHTHTTECH